LFTDRAITYRREHGFDDMKAALSVGVQKMVRSDLTGALSGLVGIFSVWFAGQYFGASTSFVRTAGLIEQFFGAERVTQMDYFIKVAPASTGNGCLFWGISGVNDPGAHLRIV